MFRRYISVESGKGKVLYDSLFNCLIKDDDNSIKLNETIINSSFAITHDNEYIGCFVNRKRKILLLQVTQNCNMRCKYCVFSDKYSRNRTTKKMSFSTAKRAVDMHFEHNTGSLFTNIGFYGGEPLLNFVLIKKVITYINKYYPYKVVYYNITTNGLLLNEIIIDFFEKNKVNLMISLDGPKTLHDARRLDANNRPTFDRVIEIIEYIKRKHKDYFKKHVTFNSVSSNIYECSIAEDYFIKHKFTGKYYVGLFSYSKNIEKIAFSENEIDRIKNNIIRKALISLLEFRGGMSLTYKSGLIDNNFFKELKTIENCLSKVRCREKIKSFHPKGQCIPSHTRCFVDVEGRLFPCEKVNEKNDFLALGTVNEDVDISRTGEVYNFACYSKAKCCRCWAIQFCSFCVGKINHDSFNNNEMDLYCEKIREHIRILLSSIIILKRIFSSYYYKCDSFEGVYLYEKQLYLKNDKE